MEILKLRKKSNSPWSILSFYYTTLFYFIGLCFDYNLGIIIIGLCLDYNLGIILAFNFWVALFDYVVDGGDLIRVRLQKKANGGYCLKMGGIKPSGGHVTLFFSFYFVIFMQTFLLLINFWLKILTIMHNA